MRSVSHSPTQDQGLPRPDRGPDLLGRALTEGLDVPLQALRASLESLARNQVRDSADGVLTRSILEAMDRLGQNVRDLIDLNQTPSPSPMRCTVSEILSSARGHLPAASQGRVTVAVDCTQTTLLVDAPLLTQVLVRILGSALEVGTGDVLLTVRDAEAGVRFGVVTHERPEIQGTRNNGEFATRVTRSPHRKSHSDLQDYLAIRDAELMRGSLRRSRGRAGETLTTLQLPGCTAQPGEVAA